MLSANWRDLLNFNPITGSHANDSVASATTFTPSDGVTKILVQAMGGNLRFTLDDTDPVAASVGYILVPDQPMIIGVQSKTILKFISDGGTLEYEWGM